MISKPGRIDEKDLVFSARYSVIRAWPFVIWTGTTSTWMILNMISDSILDGRPVKAVIFILIEMGLLLLFIHILLFREIRFYTDRVVKRRYLLGDLTIYYSEAMVQIVRPGGQFSIMKIRYGKISRQATIIVEYFFFRSEAWRNIQDIFDYLTDGIGENQARICTKTLLPQHW